MIRKWDADIGLREHQATMFAVTDTDASRTGQAFQGAFGWMRERRSSRNAANPAMATDKIIGESELRYPIGNILEDNISTLTRDLTSRAEWRSPAKEWTLKLSLNPSNKFKASLRWRISSPRSSKTVNPLNP